MQQKTNHNPELNAASAETPNYSHEELCELSDRARQGEDEAFQKLILAKLPEFRSEFRFQAGPFASSEALLEDCWQRYLRVLRTFDFRQTGESFGHRLSWQIRQARTEFITAQLRGKEPE